MNCVRHQVTKFSRVAVALIILTLFVGAAGFSAQAQTPTVLYNFQNTATDICEISGTLAQGRDGNMYGASEFCGANGNGGVFKISPAGVESLVASFPIGWGGCTAGLTLGADGNFYGSCVYGSGAFQFGSIYKATPAGVITDMYDFTGASGAQYAPYSPIQASDGNFYGVTGYPGSACGNVYKMTSAGVVTSLHTFSGTDCVPTSGLIQASDGNLYGTLELCSTFGNRGCIYKITPTGVYTVMYGFVDATGSFPASGVIQGKDGQFYGTTSLGGPTGSNGTIYKVTSAGVITDLHQINVTTDGAPSSILQATDVNLYGVGINGGVANQGSLYKLTSANTFTASLLDGTTTGSNPRSPLIQNTNGLVYGVTNSGGVSSVGTFFRVSTTAAPFVWLVTNTGKETAKVGILGQGFSSASVVKFGGTQATTVTRSGTTFLLATVPAGALTGSVTVTTGTATLTSSQTFKVKPTVTSFAPPNGPVGTSVTITGTGLTQATKVTFNGKSATFTVNSDTQITATVPTGATTGKIAVTTKGGSASSTTNFTVN